MSKKTQIIQPHDICKALGLKKEDYAVANKVMSRMFTVLAWLKQGDSFQSPDITFSKISKELLYIETELKEAQIVDHLEKRRIIKLPT